VTAELTDYEPARVHIVRDDTKPHQSERKFTNVISKTYLASTTPELILPRSAGYRCVSIQVIGVVPTQGNVILADNQADAGYGPGASGTSSYGGAVLQPGMFIHVTHNDEVWLARFGAAGSAPLVSVIGEYTA